MIVEWARTRCARIEPWLNTRRGVRLVMFAWLAASLIEYVALGPRSFIWMDDEGEVLVTHYNFLARFHPGGQYSHLIQSGADTVGSFFYGGAYVFADQILLGALPVWIGIAIHKALVFALGLAGTYLVCRKGIACSRAAALAFGALFTVMYYRLQIVTFGTGGGLALLPLGVYFLVVRSGRGRYWPGVLFYGALAAVTMTFHGLPPLMAALAGAMALFRKFHFRIVLSAGFVALAFLANNAETFNALVSVSPYSVRGSIGEGVAYPFLATLSAKFLFGIEYAVQNPVMLAPIPLAAAVFIARREWGLLARAGAAFVIPQILIAVYAAFPWPALGLSALRNIPYSLFGLGLLPLSAVVGAKAADLAAESLGGVSDGRWRSVPSLAALAVAVVVLVQYKVHNFAAWLTTAGQSMYTTVDDLRDRTWAPPEPFRAVSIWHKRLLPETNVYLGFYGVAMLDAFTNLLLKEHHAYFAKGVLRGKEDRTFIPFRYEFLDAAKGMSYRVGDQASLALLAVANVRYVFSGVPLNAPGLTFVRGPAAPPSDLKLLMIANGGHLPRDLAWVLPWLRWQLARVFHYGDIYIYEIAGALPRVYAARGISVVPDEADGPSYFALLEQLGPRRVALIRARDASPFVKSIATAEVKSFQLVKDGFDIKIDAPDGGVIVVNAARQPFFKATVDRAPAPLVSANGVQMAVPVPPGAREISIRYHRPTFGERLKRLF